jgi:hypothetical protein
MRREREGGRSVYKQPGTRVDKGRTKRKGGIPSMYEGLGNRGGFSGRRGIIKGIHQWVIKGIVPCALI